MRPLLVLLTALTLLTFLPAPASAQMTAQLAVELQTPEAALSDDVRTLTLEGVAYYTADYTAFLGLSGIPVSYALTATPAWTQAVVSPANDVFPLPMTPGVGPTYTVARAFTITVSLADAPEADATDIVELVATTTAAMGGRSATGTGQTLVTYDAPEEPCAEHALMEEQMAKMAAEAADTWNEYQAQRQEPEEVTTQTNGASPLRIPWMALAGFALVGAGVGLALKRRLGR